MKKIAISAYVYGLFILLMIFAMLSAYPVYLLSHIWSKKPRIYFQKIVQQYFRLFYKMMPLLGKVKIVNPQIANSFHPCVYASTHQSSIDYTLLATIIDDYVTPSNHFISDFALFMRVPRNALGIYYIPKGKISEVDAGYKNFNKALKINSSVIIFPEGTRNPTNELKPFKSGAFRLATQQSVPIVPIIISGTGKIVSKGSNVTKTLDKKDVTVTFLEPIYPKEGETFLEFRRKVKATMQEYIDNNYPPVS
ncbi:1-acyl-sn-glycerol-3-phosphate acyltransferase [Sulfurovum sp. bin170]|uniref:lysophospholipid acyltransferase family protein n=1 Tax=Sulfurovum sp. bin170 TaxID=2695268 RepID=UPI0013E07613|nr:lysophospholipid acyltransferase family protein [Sulfurovum sp. bin170]NEW60037.1 1-acyl-sn-glycerol-3-phosphate acyltransferase [Sulfurovum sp. bin170]